MPDELKNSIQDIKKSLQMIEMEFSKNMPTNLDVVTKLTDSIKTNTDSMHLAVRNLMP